MHTLQLLLFLGGNWGKVSTLTFFLAFITVAVVCVMDLVVWNKRGLDLIGLV